MKDAFKTLNHAYNQVFKPGQLTLGLVVPIEGYPVHAAPHMTDHVERIQLAERLGFRAVWLRDIPFHVPSFGDVGQMFDPFVYLGALAIATETIGLGVASAILPLRHPAHTAKAAASVDVLSQGRLLLGVASGDRPTEYPALDVPYSTRGDRFRDHIAFMEALASDFPHLSNDYGTLDGHVDMLPKPTAGRLPLLLTGGSQQSPDWIAQHGDGWMTYPRDLHQQKHVVSAYRHRLAEFGQTNKPVMQPLYIDVLEDPSAPPQTMHLGFRSGTEFLGDYLHRLRDVGVNHVALNLRFNHANIDDTLHQLADELLPSFHTEE